MTAPLVADYLRDLIAEIRFEREHPTAGEYLHATIDEFRHIWRHRHVARIGVYGVPVPPDQPAP